MKISPFDTNSRSDREGRVVRVRETKKVDTPSAMASADDAATAVVVVYTCIRETIIIKLSFFVYLWDTPRQDDPFICFKSFTNGPRASRSGCLVLHPLLNAYMPFRRETDI